MRDAVFPIMMITLGVLWLGFSLSWIPDTDWLIVAALFGSGVAILAIEGVTKRSIVSGPVLIGAGIAWMLRMLFGLRWHVLLPVLMILAGVLLLVARLPEIPERRGERKLRSGANLTSEPRSDLPRTDTYKP